MHKASAHEAELERAEWVTPCGRFYYGAKNFYRLDAMPPAADACLRCFPPGAEPSQEVPPAQVEERFDQGESLSRNMSCLAVDCVPKFAICSKQELLVTAGWPFAQALATC